MAELHTGYPPGFRQDDGPMPVPPPLVSSQYNPLYLGHTAVAYVTRYRGVTGWAQAPLAGPDGLPCQMVRLHAPAMEKWNSWTVRREDGGIPCLPHPEPNANEIFADWEITAACPDLDDSGSVRSFTVSGVYHYFCLAVRTSTDGYPVPSALTDLMGFGAHILGGAQFLTGVFGPVTPPAGAAGIPPGPTGGEGFFP